MIPQFEEFLYPFLVALKDGNLTTKEMKAKMVEYFNLTAEDCATMTKGGILTNFLIELDGVGSILEGHCSSRFLKGELMP